MINNLQILRAFAAIIVVLYHLVEDAARFDSTPNVFAPFLVWGASGVDLFFVLSGFIMVLIDTRRRRSPFEFMKARAIRILPIYYIVTLSWAFVIFVTSDYSIQYADPARILASLFLSSQLLGFGFPYIVPGWTLEYEALFYILFAASIGLLRSHLLVAPTILLLCILTNLSYIALEFVFGMLIGKLYFSDYFKRINGLPILLVGGALWLISFFYQIDHGAWNGFLRTLVWGIPAALVVLGALSIKQSGPGILTFAGAASYSIYITHWCSIVVFGKFLSYLGISEPNIDTYILASAVFCIAVGITFFILIERPIAMMLNRSPLPA